MRTDEIPLPRSRVIQAALRTTTEVLARELANPGEHAPHWSKFEWQVARAVAAIHGVSSLLSRNLRWDGPADWTAFLAEQATHTSERHRRLLEMLTTIDARARTADLGLVALKGAALHRLGLYEAGERPMADLDLLARPADADRVARLLESLGLVETFANWRHRLFEPPHVVLQTCLGEQSNGYLKVELHERIVERLRVREVSVTHSVLPGCGRPGLNCYPSRAALMSHLLLHAAGAMAERALRLLHLSDLARLAACMQSSEWNELLQQLPPGTAHWVFPPLRLMTRYFGNVVPASVLCRFEAACPPRLRRIADRQLLSDVSLSNPWIEAFPGIEWSQSLGERLRYMRARLRPGAEILAQRARVAGHEAAAWQSEWHRLPQSRRIVRWLVAHPMRAETLHPIRVAVSAERR